MDICIYCETSLMCVYLYHGFYFLRDHLSELHGIEKCESETSKLKKNYFLVHK